MNSTAKPYISGRRVHSEPRQVGRAAQERAGGAGHLDDLRDALAAFTAGLKRYTAATAQLDDRHPGLALDHGLAVHRASLRWTRHAIAALHAAPAPAPQSSP